ncbi:MAG TPA: hypothetical protein VLO13_07885, partial [Halomonas sp.]|nr:hypothetical protein [Halomonas sp.]
EISLRDKEVPAYFQDIMKTPLRDKIESSTYYLADIYIRVSILSTETKHERNHLENNAAEYFFEEYATSLKKLKARRPATNCVEEIQETLCENLEGDAYNLYPVAFTWVACADLLEKEGLGEKAWSALLEYAYLGPSLVQACELELLRLQDLRHQARENHAHSGYNGLEQYFIEVLSTKTPKSGWETIESTLDELVEHVWDYHGSPEYHGKKFTNELGLRKRLRTWIKNHKEPNKVYHKNRRKR